MGKIVQDSITGRHGNGRLRRAVEHNTSCEIYLVADTYFFHSIGNDNVGDSIIYMVCLSVCVRVRTHVCVRTCV